MNAPNLLFYLFPVFIAAILVEYRLNRDAYERADFITNTWVALGGGVMGAIASLYAIVLYFFFYEELMPFRNEYLGYETVSWAWYVWPIVLVADDLSYYWFHRLGHRVRLLWACHVVHHSSEHYNFTTALRNGWIAILYKPLFWVWLAAFGVHPAMILVCMSINTGYQFFIHSSIGGRMHFFSGFLVTPGLHEIHHGRDPHCIDRNYSGTFIFIDRLFGTYQPEEAGQKIQLGVTVPPGNNSVSEVMFHEFKNIYKDLKTTPGIIKRVKVLFYPPGYPIDN